MSEGVGKEAMLRNALEVAQAERDSLQAKYDELKEENWWMYHDGHEFFNELGKYVRHMPTCDVAGVAICMTEKVCTCGLSEMLLNGMFCDECAEEEREAVVMRSTEKLQ